VRRIRALLRHRLEREEKVVAALEDKPRPLGELLPVVYADTAQDLWGWAEMSLLAHLEKLERDHRASRDDRGWRAAAR
jgi:hypothetical protein